MSNLFKIEYGKEIKQKAETIIDEKWEELMKGVDKIISWKELTEERLVKIEQNIEELKKRFSELHTGILGKISDYDQGIRNVGTEEDSFSYSVSAQETDCGLSLAESDEMLFGASRTNILIPAGSITAQHHLLVLVLLLM